MHTPVLVIQDEEQSGPCMRILTRCCECNVEISCHEVDVRDIDSGKLNVEIGTTWGAEDGEAWLRHVGEPI